MHPSKVVIPPELRTHEGSGEVTEFDTQVPHWFGAAGVPSVAILSLLGKHGERINVRAAPRRKNDNG